MHFLHIAYTNPGQADACEQIIVAETGVVYTLYNNLTLVVHKDRPTDRVLTVTGPLAVQLFNQLRQLV